MHECTKDFSPLDHIAIDVTDISENSKFFEDVLGMRICRTMGPEDDPSSVWFDGGIQLCKVADPSQENGRFQHLGFQVISVDAVLEKAKPFGAVPIPGKGRHWFMLPNGIKFEMKEK